MIRLSTGLRNAMLSVGDFQTAIDNGVIELYSGPQPASADDAVRGTLLGTFTVGAGAFTPGTGTNGLSFAEAASGAITKAVENWQIGDAAGVAGAIAAGQAGWFRLKANAADAGSSSTTLKRLDGSVGTTGADLNLANTSLVIGTPVTIDTFTLTLPSE